MMSADRIFLRICSFEGCSLMRKRTSVLHFRNLPKYSWTCFQYLSESELAVGIKRSFGFFLFESRIISRSIVAVPRVLISPPPIATIALGTCSSYFEFRLYESELLRSDGEAGQSHEVPSGFGPSANVGHLPSKTFRCLIVSGE